MEYVGIHWDMLAFALASLIAHMFLELDGNKEWVEWKMLESIGTEYENVGMRYIGHMQENVGNMSGT